MRRKLTALAQLYPRVVREGAKTVAERKLELARARAPEKTGRLKRDSRVTVSIRREGGGKKVVATIRFNAPYAGRVHETHKDKPKFLESVVREAVPTAGYELAREMQLSEAIPK